jgi:hypothetical protein
LGGFVAAAPGFNKGVISAEDPSADSAFFSQAKNIPDRGGIC